MDGDMKWVDWFAIIWWIALIALFVLLASLSCVPLQITNVQVTHDECDCLYVGWLTNQETIGKVTYCKDGMCYTSPLEETYATEHFMGLPERTAELIIITVINSNGQAVSLEIK